MTIESEKEFGFKTKLSFGSNYADASPTNSDKTSHLTTKIKYIMSKLKLPYGDNIEIRNWERKAVELT
jgi:hypothetical protein